MDPCISSLVLFMVVVRQCGRIVSATANDLSVNKSVFILDDKNVPQVKISVNILIDGDARTVKSPAREVKDA